MSDRTTGGGVGSQINPLASALSRVDILIDWLPACDGQFVAINGHIHEVRGWKPTSRSPESALTIPRLPAEAGREHAVKVPGYGFVDTKAVRAIEAHIAKVLGLQLADPGAR